MLYVAVAARTFRRYSTYRAATLAGIFTNTVFGIIYSFVYLAVWAARPDAGGYDAVDAVTYVWLGQALIMTLAIWGGGTPTDLAERIRSGDVAVDFYRPVPLLAWYVAADVGRAAYHLLTRGLAPTVIGAVLFDLHVPSPLGLLGFVAALVPALLVSFGIRFLFATVTFWVLDDAGLRIAQMALGAFFSGLTVPLVLFPGWFGDLVMALPWAALLQVPADIWLGQRSGGAVLTGLAFQAAWAVALLLACARLLAAAERRVVVQGG